MLKTGSEEEVVLEAAACITGSVFRAVERRGFSTLVLSGGNSPRKLYRLLAEGVPASALQAREIQFPTDAVILSQGMPRAALPWQSIMLFWGDERCVPAGHADSNHRMARETLIAAADIPEKNIFPMPHVTGNYNVAAEFYEKELKRFFERQKQSVNHSFPVFDIIILGMGGDGHTASLFPEDRAALEETDRWVLPVYAPHGSPPGYRLSLTLPVINSARSVLFFVTGEKKEKMVHDITSGHRSDLPAALVKPKHGELVWFYGKE